MSWSVDRREFMRILAAVGAGATAACTGRRKETILARFEPEANIVPGQSIYYATTCRECPAGCGMLACTRMGRVMKLEGNPAHPRTNGRLCARGQAAVQGLYNPDRVTRPLARGDDDKLFEVSWDGAEAALYKAIGRRIGEGRGAAVAWLTGETSDSDADLVDLVTEATGIRKPVNLRLFSEAPLAAAAKRLFDYNGVPEFDFAQADLLISVGADFLETWGNPVEQAAGFTAMHAQREGAHGRAVYVGPRQSSTAVSCDEWIAVPPGQDIAALALIVIGFMDRYDADFPAVMPLLGEQTRKTAEAAVGGAAAQALQKLGAELTRFKAPLVIASGLGADAEQAHALALAISSIRGTGKTVRFPNLEAPEGPARAPRGDSIEKVRALFDDLQSGAVEVLLVHECNPAFLLPETASTLASLKAEGKAPFVACFATQRDETASLADLVLPIRHPLESWGDYASAAGVVGLIQPAMKPLREVPAGEGNQKEAEVRAFADVLIKMARSLPGMGWSMVPWRSAQDYCEARLETYHRTSDSVQPLEEFKREAKRRGGLWTDIPQSQVVLSGKVAQPDIQPPGGLPTLLFPHPYWYDGRGADKPWLQEVPESTTSVVWGTWAEVHPETAKNLKIGKGDALVLKNGENEIAVPVLITEQIVVDAVAVPIGQGHESLGRYASGRGANPLRLLDLSSASGNLALAGLPADYAVRGGGGRSLLRLAGSQNQGKRRLARAVGTEGEDEHEHFEKDQTLYPKHPHPDYDWAMVIDLDVCTGCGACVAACYAENNVAVVGPERVREGREMAWIRIEKYADKDGTRFLLNLCQQCHHAPCETVCPVHATYHNPEGLNAMVYNRCVGTRYCSNNCPYKVRRFNYFDYVADPPLNLQYNPYVTVRERGVMEKCTFCVQRISEAKETAKNENRAVRDDEAVPACAQTCPAGAIAFGNVADQNGEFGKRLDDPRAYQLLDDLGTRPSVTYLKRVLRDERT